jgi:tetratricopeptide (TPR) repeat protein
MSAAWAQTPPATTVPPPTTPDPAKPDATPQPSQEEVDAARHHFESGVDFFQRGNYAAARAEFEASYALTKYPQLLFNLGKTAEKLNQTADAIRYLESYLSSNPSATDTTEVRAKLADLRQRADAPAAPLTTPPPAAPSKLPPIAALALLGGGAGLLIIGIGCGAGALAAADAIKPGTTTSTGALSQGKTLEATAIAFDVIGGLALAAGGAWTGYWLSQRHKASKAAPPAVSLVPMGLGAGIAGRF